MHLDEKMGRAVLLPFVVIQLLATGMSAPVLGMSAPVVSDAWRGEAAITCTNLSSGASFQIKIDYGRSTVDTNPAQISDREISWRDQNRWNYTLDRKSGNLTIILASSTGGSFLYDRCKLEN
jgi:hypothetical protein